MPSFSIPLSGLTASSTALSTIANNLANLNTIGYKDELVQFSDLFYENLGTNGAGDPIQQGAGTTISSMPSNFTQGNVTPTGVSTNVAVMGSGFFVVQQNGAQSYTRAGNFEVGTDNLLETADGQQVLGYQATNGVIGTSLGTLALGTGTISPASATSMVQLTSNLDATAAINSSYSTNVTVYDSLGASHNITFTFTKTATNNWTYSASIPLADINPATGTSPSDPVVLTSGALTFDGNGNLLSPTPSQGGTVAISTQPFGTLADGAKDLAFNWTALTATGAASRRWPQPTVPPPFSKTAAAVARLVISASGPMVRSRDPSVTARLRSSDKLRLPALLIFRGCPTLVPTIFLRLSLPAKRPLVRGTRRLGSISGGALEQSNVDIASEFASLIIAQRSYEANARVVTTFDQVAQDTINLKQ